MTYADEPDAFPYKGNDVLHGIASCAVRGHTLYLTATPDEYLRERVHNGTVSELKLSVRPHGHPVPVPRIRISFVPVLLIWLIRWLKEHSSHPRMVFVPTIALAGRLYRFVSLFAECCVCTGKTENRDDVIESFRKQEHGIMICTTVLERGVTIPGADVCVWRADHGVFDEASLVQIAGRAGRSFSCPDGDVLFLCRTKSGLAQDCRSSLLEVNRCAA